MSYFFIILRPIVILLSYFCHTFAFCRNFPFFWKKLKSTKFLNFPCHSHTFVIHVSYFFKMSYFYLILRPIVIFLSYFFILLKCFIFWKKWNRKKLQVENVEFSKKKCPSHTIYPLYSGVSKMSFLYRWVSKMPFCCIRGLENAFSSHRRALWTALSQEGEGEEGEEDPTKWMFLE